MTVVFMDRDGVINVNRDDYVKSAEEFELIPGVTHGLARLKRAGVPVIVISNQAGVASGAIPEEELHRINDLMFKAVRYSGGDIAAWYYCTHRRDEGCNCRKPETGLFLKAGSELGMDLSDAFLVGDAETDIEAGHRAGCKTVLVLTGRARAEDVDRWAVKPCYIAQNLPDAVDWILSNARMWL